MSDWGARTRRSAAGGRSIAHAAAAVLGAPLRTSSLVEPAPWLSLRNPLATLIAGAPVLDGLAESAARALDGDRLTGRRGAPGADASRSTPAAPRSRTPAATVRSTMVGLLTRSTSPGESTGGSTPIPGAAGRPPVPRQSPSPDRPAGAGPRNRPDVPGVDPVPDRGSSPAPAVGASSPSTSSRSPAPVGVARTDGRRSPAAPMWTPSTGFAIPDPPRHESFPPTMSQPSMPQPSMSPPAVPQRDPVTTPRLPSTMPFDLDAAVHDAAVRGGALGELVGRWSQPSAWPDRSHAEGESAGQASVSASGFTGSPFGGAPPDTDVLEVSMDRVQLALGELLRREAEQHGLDGGPM